MILELALATGTGLLVGWAFGRIWHMDTRRARKERDNPLRPPVKQGQVWRDSEGYEGVVTCMTWDPDFRQEKIVTEWSGPSQWGEESPYPALQPRRRFGTADHLRGLCTLARDEHGNEPEVLRLKGATSSEGDMTLLPREKPHLREVKS